MKLLGKKILKIYTKHRKQGEQNFSWELTAHPTIISLHVNICIYSHSKLHIKYL